MMNPDEEICDPEDLQALQQSHAFTQQIGFLSTIILCLRFRLPLRVHLILIFRAGIEPANRDDVDSLSSYIKPSFDV